MTQPVLLVENEFAIKGWDTSSPYVYAVNAGIPLRAWPLSPGRYTFTASFHEPARTPQELAAIAAVLLWVASILALQRRPLWFMRQNRANAQAS